MTEPPVELWLFYPENNQLAVDQAKQLIGTECAKRKWTFQARPTHLIKPNGRPIGQIKPEDATNLYKRMHRARVGVWHIEHADVSRRPLSSNRVTDYVTLGRFVLNKAYLAKLPSTSLGNAWISSLAEFLYWLRDTLCHNEGDPRCLPFHVFDTGFDLKHLISQDGRQRFADVHGAQSSRLDKSGLRWARGTPHGQEILQVAGRKLTAGFHWDVVGKPKQQIVTTSAVWELKPGGYVNIYPDAHIRGRSNGAKRVILRK